MILLIFITVILYNWSQFQTWTESKINNLITKYNPKWFEMYKMERPFLNIYDQNDRMLNIVFITHHFTRDDCIENYTKASTQGIKFIGMSSYCEFPAIISNPHDVLHDPKHKAYDYDYYKLTKG